MNGTGLPWADSGDTPSRPRLRGVQRADVAIVGAGLTGLAAAVELLELDPGRRVVLLEADRVAAGASGRGTGLLGPRVGPALAASRRRFGDDLAREMYLWSVTAVWHLLGLIDRHKISCDLTPGGQLIVAADEQGAEEQYREAEAARLLGLPISLVMREALPAIAAKYVSGLRYSPAATLDPAALTRQLARIGEQLGLTLYERSPVRSIKPGLLITVTTDDGEILADHVIVAVNAYAGPLAAPSGVVGVRVQAGVTEKLPHDALAALDGLRTEPLIEHGELTPYFRLTPDGRMVVGGGVVQRGVHGSLAPSPGRLREAVRRLSPALSGVELESTWSGPIGVTRDGLPVVGRDPRDPQIYHAGGCNGHGLAVSAHNGAYLARWIANGDSDHLSFAWPWVRSRAPWVPRGRLVDGVLDSVLRRLTAAADRS